MSWKGDDPSKVSADIKVVKELCAELVKAFEAFINRAPKEIEYLDALMGCHNFYKCIILDLEKRTGSKIIRQVALNTLFEALGRQ